MIHCLQVRFHCLYSVFILYTVLISDDIWYSCSVGDGSTDMAYFVFHRFGHKKSRNYFPAFLSGNLIIDRMMGNKTATVNSFKSISLCLIIFNDSRKCGNSIYFCLCIMTKDDDIAGRLRFLQAGLRIYVLLHRRNRHSNHNTDIPVSEHPVPVKT